VTGFFTLIILFLFFCKKNVHTRRALVAANAYPDNGKTIHNLVVSGALFKMSIFGIEIKSLDSFYASIIYVIGVIVMENSLPW